MTAASARLTRFVWITACLALPCLAGSLVIILWSAEPAPPVTHLAVAGALSAAAYALRLDIRLGSHRWVLAWGDTALVLALLVLPVPWVIPVTAVGRAAGGAVSFLRHQPVKLIYNTSVHILAATLAVGTATSIGHLPLDVREARDVAALLAAGVVYDLTCNTLIAAVIAVANASKPSTAWRGGLGLQTLTMAGNLTATAGALALASMDRRLILVLPVAAVVLQQAYQAVQRSRADRDSARQLAQAISALGHLDEATILSRTATHAAALLSADSAEVVLHPTDAGAQSAAVFSPPSGSGASRLQGPWWTEAVDLLDPDADDPVGEIRVHFVQPVRLTDRERGLLSTLAAATRNALAAASAHAEAEHLAAVLSHEVTHDAVTALPTRQLLLERIDTHLDQARHSDRTAVGVILIGLVEFSEVSRTLGHEARDQLLHHAAQRLRHAGTLGELAARLDDNQFAVFVHEVDHLRDLRSRSDSLLAALATPIRLDAGVVSLDATAGIAYARPTTTDSTELLRQATVALAATWRTGSRIEYYRPAEDTSSGPSALLVATELQEALRAGQLTLHYQPIIDLHSGAPVAAEALVRWLHPNRGMLPPHYFVPVLEQASLLAPYTDWLLHEALTERARWDDLDPALPVSVNLSARSLLDRELPTRVTDAVANAGLRPQQLMLELTESLALSTMSIVDRVLEDLRALGVRIAVDDFGSGYSSLARLLRVPATDLKIAPELIDSMLGSPQARAIVHAAAGIANSVNLRVTAVGARSASHLLAARDAGVHAAQGHAIEPPMVAVAAHAALLSRTRTAELPIAQVIQLHPEPDWDNPS
jgi:diguanylate cyclase (GGDEF)-like protein